MVLKGFSIAGASVICMLSWASLAHGQTVSPSAPDKAATMRKGTETSGTDAPAPADPYPLNAAGWGPGAGNGLFFSRWVEDWTGMRTAGTAPPLKAMPLGRETSLTLSAEARLRYDTFNNGQFTRDNDYQQGLFRGILGADLRFSPGLRVYGELGTGRVDNRRSAASANVENDASLQQLFVDVRGHVDATLVGALIGRQEFADGPRQLIGLGDGANLHRTWNGVRLYAHSQRFRLGAFDLRVTQQGRESFDEKINHDERLRGLNGSLIVSPGEGSDTYLDPFWMHSENPAFRSGGHMGLDSRDTYGARLWRRSGEFRFDWTLARQTGHYLGRGVDAWSLFAVQSLALSGKGWKPRLGAHIDAASGGGTYASGTLKGFNQLYASSGYLGEGRFLSASNLLLIAPGISVSPTSATSLSAEYGFARRLRQDDAAYAGLMRAYPGTQNVPGREIGGLLRIAGTWAYTRNLNLFFDYERLIAGDVLKRARLPSGSYGYVGATFRY